MLCFIVGVLCLCLGWVNICIDELVCNWFEWVALLIDVLLLVFESEVVWVVILDLLRGGKEFVVVVDLVYDAVLSG